ncbi:ATP-binding protein [Providencia vermicola]|uniref:ATP-binding protein n=1 Tax=Providencia vermicola TaxID=333965 RepID=UPI002AB457AA|nr:response regulator [Providencia stuartii]
MNRLSSEFSRVTKTSSRISSLLFVALPLLLILLTTLFWSAERIIVQEKRRLEVDFSSFIGYLREQENFLWTLKKQNQNLSQLVESRTYALQHQKTPNEWPLKLLEGKESIVAMPFTLACDEHLECAQVPNILFSLGAYLADFYATFWGASYYPAAAVFFVNSHNNVSIGVPSVGKRIGNESVTPATFRTVTETVRNSLPQLHIQFEQYQQQGTPNKIIWLHNPELGDNLIGIVPAGFDANLWRGAQLFPDDIYAVTLLNRERISVLERILNPTLSHQFWLLHHEYGQLIGASPAPQVPENGLHYTRDGLLLKLNNKTGEWVGYYLIGYAAFFEDNLWLPLSLLAAFLFSLLCGWGYYYWYNKSILNPAIKAQNSLLESENFNRTLMDTTPIGLCVIEKQSTHVLYLNALAREWFSYFEHPDRSLTPEYQQLLSLVLLAPKKTGTASWSLNERTLHVIYAHTHYQQHEVVLCAFTDMSAQMEIEHQLHHAKLAAEEASKVKSNFLATMSHEIRTPLYGLIGTLELFSSTSLSEQQALYLQRMNTASQLLMHLIGDILDISKIEATQLRLQNSRFNLFDIIHTTVQTYSELANQKGLLLFACIDPSVLPERFGDPLRLQQILGNLISNAIKFTHQGTIIVTVSIGQENMINISVKDTGIGLTPSQKAQLFEPFYQAHIEPHTYGGTGLGLVICQRLVELMGGTIHVHSQLNEGSEFFLSLPLSLVTNTIIWPDLTGINVLLKTPHIALTQNLQQWLTYWGANVWSNPPPTVDEALILYLVVTPFELSQSLDWKGQTLVVSSSTLSLMALAEQLTPQKTSQTNNEKDLLHSTTTPNYPIHILVAEDNPINQAVLQEQLQQLGCYVLLANDGEEALALWDSHPVDIDMVLTDVNMPYLNGYDLSRQLRKEGATCPIIGVTANGLKEEEEYCLNAGMDEWLTKPLWRNTLVQLLERYFPSNEINLSDFIDIKINNPLDGADKKSVISHLKHDISQLKYSIEQQDIETIRDVAHRLRGALVIVQQPSLANDLRVLENQLIPNNYDQENLNELNELCFKLESWIKQIS